MSNEEAVILVLGCRIERVDEGGNISYIPSATLTHRLDGALELYKSLTKEKSVVVLLSGGGRGDVTEASVMANYLIKRGVPSPAILLEENSMSTIENCLESLMVIYKYYMCHDLRFLVCPYYGTGPGVDGERRELSSLDCSGMVLKLPESMYIVSSDFHIPRTKAIWKYFKIDTLFQLEFNSTPTPAPEREMRRRKENRTNVRRKLCRHSQDAVVKLFSGGSS